MQGATLGLALVALIAVACASDDRLELEPFEVRGGALLFANDEELPAYEDWFERQHFAVPRVEVPAGLALVNAYSYRPDADLDLSLVSLFFEDAEDPRRWLLVKFDDRAAFPLRAEPSTPMELGAVEGRTAVYVNGVGDPWHDLVFESCGFGVAVKGHADVWARADIEAVARAIVDGCDDPRGPAGN